MKRLNSRISIGRFQLRSVTSVEVESSFDELTDKAKITMPRKLEFQGKTIAKGNSLFSKGDPVKIELGYDGQLTKIFEGFITGIKPQIPLEFTCEDAMWKLKQTEVTKFSNSDTSLSGLLNAIMPSDVPFEAVDAKIGAYRVSHTNVAKVLKDLRDNYGLFSWVRDGKLFSGLAFREDAGEKKRRTFRFQFNIIENDLEYKKEDDIKIKVRAVSLDDDNNKTVVEVGDKDGAQRTIHKYNLTKPELKKVAQESFKTLVYEGFEGAFKAFGKPLIRHGDVAVLEDPKIPDHNGSYLVKRVKTNFGTGGFRQEIELERKIA